MKQILLCLWSLVPVFVFGQSEPYFQQKTDYHIKVQLHPESQTLDGSVHLIYKNNSPDTLHFIWIHLWPDAFKSDRTAFSEQLLRNGRTDFYFSNDDQRGYINRLNFTVNGKDASLEDSPFYLDVTKLLLPEPLAPGDSAIIETPFHEKLPYLWSGEGFDENFFSVTNWYPQPSVYDKNGWHPMPFLDRGRGYNEFGSFEVEIRVPSAFEVVTSGELAGTVLDGKIKRLNFEATNISEFAWFAFRNYRTDSAVITSADGHPIEVRSYYPKDISSDWKNSISLIRQAIQYREKEIRSYPFQSIKIIAGPPALKKYLSYSSVSVIPGTKNKFEQNKLISKAVGENWFHSVLASDARNSPWMETGMNTYYTQEYLQNKNSSEIKNESFFGKRTPDDLELFNYNFQISEKLDQPISTSASAFSKENYKSIAKTKTAIWMKKLKQALGNNFNTAIQHYYNDWKFKHPDTKDFEKTVNKFGSAETNSLFNLLDSTGAITHEKKSFKLASFYSFRNTDKYNYLFASPALGFNYYDKLMAGILVHNYTLPEPKFHFLFAPMYGTESHSFTGLGRIGYTISSYGFIRKAELALSGATFNMNEFTDSTGKKNFMNFTKVVPSLTLHFRRKDPTIPTDNFIQWKTFFISEHSLLFTYDSVIQGNVITYPKSSYYINQLKFVHKNDRVLYPFDYNIELQQSKDFIRTAIEGKMFFNYPKEGGLSVRLFAGKFMYLGDKTLTKEFGTTRFHLNLTGPNGSEDYTYSNYFIGRNEFHGFSQQQIMTRDGDFKVRTDLLSSKIGKTDDWLSAANFNTTIPKKFNPLSVLPFKIGLNAFLDLGTYAEAWNKNASTGRFLFDAGLQLSLLKNVLNIYVPVLYSKVYRDYYKTTIPKGKRFWNTISFSIDIQNFKLKNFLGFLNE